MGQSRRTVRCTFCGLIRPQAKEDVIPKWLARELGGVAPFVAEARHFSGSDELISRTERKVGSAAAYKLRGVCVTCNNGWMSELENAARAVLLPMVRGETVVLDATAQVLVASWCAKTALTLDAWDRPRGVPEEVGTRLLERQGVPPPGCRVLIGSIMPIPGGIGIPHARRELPLADAAQLHPTSERFVVLTFGFGYFLFQVWLFVGPVHRFIVVPPTVGLDMLWPYIDRPVTWPRAVLTPGAFLGIASVEDVQDVLVRVA
ncbi:MAG: hypothetical protein JWN67_1982 [Actinomycetia bacterium]|nr:hypothetical protein [Actinomycetes bacterium]